MYKFENDYDAVSLLNGDPILSKALIKWWYDIKHIIHFSFDISLYEILFHINILSFELEFKFNPIHYLINISDKLRKKLTKVIKCNIAKYKTLKLKMLPDPSLGIGLTIHHQMHCNNAGIFIELKFMLISISLDFYDWRYWNNKRIIKELKLEEYNPL